MRRVIVWGWAVVAWLAVVCSGTHAQEGRRHDYQMGTLAGSLSSPEHQLYGAMGSLSVGRLDGKSGGHHAGFLPGVARATLRASTADLDFGLVKVGESETLDLLLTNVGTLTLSLDGLVLPDESPIQFATNSPLRLVQAGQTETVRLSYSPQSEDDSNEEIVIRTNDSSAPVWVLTVRGSTACRPTVAEIDKVLPFGQIPVDDMVSEAILIENTGCAELSVGPITSSNPEFTVATESFTVGAESSFELQIEFTPLIAGARLAILTIPTNDPQHSEESLTVNLSGTGQVSSDIRIVEDSIVQVLPEGGQSAAPDVFTLTNDGGGILNWEAIVDPSEPWLTVLPSSGTIPRGETNTIEVFYSAIELEPGSYSASLSVENTDREGDVSTLDVGLQVAPFRIVGVNAPETTPAGVSPTVRVEVETQIDPDGGLLHYRATGGSVFESVPMTVEGNRLEGEIPSSAIGPAGVEYFAAINLLGATINANSELDPLRMLVALSDGDARSPVFAGRKHHMVSVPVDADLGPGAVLVDDLGEHDVSSWRFAHYTERTGTPQLIEFPEDLGVPMTAGVGFWLITAEDQTFDAEGLSVLPSVLSPQEDEAFFPIDLEGRPSAISANQIGNPFAFPVAWDDCRIRFGDETLTPFEAAQAGWIDRDLYTYDADALGGGGFVSTEVLQPWHGYFVGNVSNDELQLLVPAKRAVGNRADDDAADTAGPTPQFAGGSEKTAPRRAAEEWTLELQVLGENDVSGDAERPIEGRASSVLLGQMDQAAIGWDAFDHFQPPGPSRQIPELALLPISDRMPSTALRSDVRPPSETATSWRIEVSFHEPTERTLTVIGLENLPGDFRAVLLSEGPNGQSVQELESETRLLPALGRSVRQYRVVVGPEAALDDQGLTPKQAVLDFALQESAPNPFSDVAAIRYSVPYAGPVRASVFDVNGRLVRRLVDEFQEAGEHVRAWNGRTDGGHVVPAGIYFVRLRHESNQATIRLVRKP